MEYGKQAGKYIKTLTGFQFNCLKPISRLHAKDLATELGISYMRFTKLQKTPLFSEVVCIPETYNNLLRLIEKYRIVFPKTNLVELSPGKLPLVSNGSLTAFQYRTAIFLLYGQYIHLKARGISLVDDYFHSLENFIVLEDAVSQQGLIHTLKNEFEERGIHFPNPYAIQLKNQLRPFDRKEIEELFCLDDYYAKLKFIDLSDIKLLKALIDLSQQSNEIIEVSYKQLEQKMNLTESALRKRLAKMEKVAFINRYLKHPKERNRIQGSFIHVRLNIQAITRLTELRDIIK